MRGKMKWGDFAIIGAVLLLAAALAGLLAVRAAGDRIYAEVWQDGELTQRVLLAPDTRQTIDLDGHNTIQLDGLTARMENADCRDQVCVRTGTLTRAGQTAVCLPNRVVLKLTGEKTQVDAIVS